MIQAARTGIFLGLTLAVLIGPVFFALLQTSIHKGFGAGVLIAFGISVSDIIYMFISNVFVSTIQNLTTIEYWLGMVGGFVLIIIGIQTFFRPPKLNGDKVLPKRTVAHNAGLIGRGFILNFTHPGVLIFWLSVTGVLSAEFQYTNHEKLMLFSFTALTVLSTDILKSYAAHKIKRLLTHKILIILNHTMGIILILFGLGFIVKTLWF